MLGNSANRGHPSRSDILSAFPDAELVLHMAPEQSSHTQQLARAVVPAARLLLDTGLMMPPGAQHFQSLPLLATPTMPNVCTFHSPLRLSCLWPRAWPEELGAAVLLRIPTIRVLLRVVLAPLTRRDYHGQSAYSDIRESLTLSQSVTGLECSGTKCLGDPRGQVPRCSA
jgi:hypothetical protein